MLPPWKYRAVVLLVALVAGLATTVVAAPYGARTMAPGMQGADVRELQVRLLDLGYLNSAADGVFGPRTLAAVTAFQRDYGLAASGDAGRWTIMSLDRAFAWENSVWYAVQAGETLDQVARRFGTRPEVITWMNRLPPGALYTGQILRVPARPPAPPEPRPAPVQPAGQPQIHVPPSDPGELPPPPPMPEPPPPPPDRPGALPPLDSLSPIVMGYYVEYYEGDRLSLTSMDRGVEELNVIVSFQYHTDAFGNLTGRDYPELMAEASRQGIHVFALVHNWDDKLAGFDRPSVRQMLATAESRERAAANMVNQLKGKGFSGMNLDLENVPPSQRAEYTDLVARLRPKLRAEGMALTLSIPAKRADNPADGWSGAFDYAALGPLADLIAIMAYDEHSPGFAAGPIASFEWVDQVMAYAASQIPADRLLMGVAGYAYDWVEGTGTARGLSVPRAKGLAAEQKARIQWDGRARVPYFRYTDDRGRQRIVYYEDAASTGEKLKLVQRHGLRGIGLWRLGLEDPDVWATLGRLTAAP